MNQLLSTEAVPRNQRLAYWTDMICNVYVQLGCDAVHDGAGGDFEGSIRQHTLPGLDVSVVTSAAQRVMRTPGHISRSGDDCFLVSIQARGQGVVRQDGRDAVLAAGDFALYDSTRPYELLFDKAFEQIVLKLPGERLRSELHDTEALTATTVSGREGAGHLLLGMIRTLREDIDTLQPASALAVANGVQSILVAGLQTLPAARAPGPQQPHGLPPGSREAPHRRATGGPVALGGEPCGRVGRFSKPHSPRFQERAAHAFAVHMGAPARSVQPRPARAAPCRPAGGRHCLWPRLQRCGALQPRIPRTLRLLAARVAAATRSTAMKKRRGLRRAY
jgi:hypothetical protein